MIRNFIKRICKWIYIVGRHETYLQERYAERNRITATCIVDDTCDLTQEANVRNLTGERYNLQIGANSLIRGELIVYNFGGCIKVGRDCFIGPSTRIWSCGSIEIGDRVLISHNVNIHDNNSHEFNPTKRHEDFLFMLENKGLLRPADLGAKSIVIEDDAWIGFNSVILKGVRIGKGAIVGAGSIVTKDVEPYSVVIGSPAVKIKEVASTDRDAVIKEIGGLKA